MTHTAVRRPTHREVSAERDRQPDLRWWCPECGAVFCLAAARAVRFTCADCHARLKEYTPEELLSRPLEHTTDLLGPNKLGAILGCGRTTASLLKSGERDLTETEAQRLRDWLALCARDGMVIGQEGTPASANSRGTANLERAEVCV